MTLIRNGEIIVLTKREKNLFILDLICLGAAMAIISQKTIAIIGQG